LAKKTLQVPPRKAVVGGVRGQEVFCPAAEELAEEFGVSPADVRRTALELSVDFLTALSKLAYGQ